MFQPSDTGIIEKVSPFRILWQNFSSAVIRSYQDDDGHTGMLMPSGCLGSPCAMMDPADSRYKQHLVSPTWT